MNLSTNKIKTELFDIQHGFLARHSTCTELLESTNEWLLKLNSKSSVDVIYIDFRRAFDSVVHSKLLYKFTSFKILALKESYYVGLLNFYQVVLSLLLLVSQFLIVYPLLVACPRAVFWGHSCFLFLSMICVMSLDPILKLNCLLTMLKFYVHK